MLKIKANEKDFETPILYAPCFKNNVSAIFRLIALKPKPTQMMLNHFEVYCQSLQNEFTIILGDFTVDRNQWFNHLERKKQDEVFQFVTTDDQLIDHGEFLKNAHVYENFVKSEKQFLDNGEMPKTRCICAPSAYVKYIMGPVVLEMERLFKEKMFGYKVPQNWQLMEIELNKYHDEGFQYTTQLDGSGFDLTQHPELKRIVDHKIYNLIPEDGLHTSIENFYNIYSVIEREVKVMIRTGGKNVSVGRIVVKGQTFSGSPDTTLMNTVRMAIYNRYVHYLAGIEEETDYKLWVKGDDVVVFYKDPKNQDKALQYYKNVFADKSQVDYTTVRNVGAHKHICVKCTKEYVHDHPFKNAEHEQYPNQCPYEDCEWYHNEINPTNSRIILLEHGLGQIAKFYKVGDLTDIDFCSINVIRTLEQKYKIIRKIENIQLKQNYSLKATHYNQAQFNLYNHELLTAAEKWLGGDNILRRYYSKIHLHNPFLAKIYQKYQEFREKCKPSSKVKLKLENLLPDKGYLNRIKDYEDHLLDERVSDTTLTDIDIALWISSKKDNELYKNTILAVS